MPYLESKIKQKSNRPTDVWMGDNHMDRQTDSLGRYRQIGRDVGR